MYRIATTNVPLLHSCPGGVKREQIVQDLPGGKSTTFFQMGNNYFEGVSGEKNVTKHAQKSDKEVVSLRADRMNIVALPIIITKTL